MSNFTEAKSENSPLLPVLISPADLSSEALEGIIESFILREGTDYGSVEVDHSKKVSQIHHKITRKEFLITFDPETESINLLTRHQWDQLQKEKSNAM
jgi:uncharacterized protein YheU (UPF0270 family)